MGELSDFEDEEFYGFCSDSEQRRENPEELRNEIESTAYAISTFGAYTEEYMASKLNLDEKKEELSKQIELSFGF